ncbi:hypothetical protein D3C71_1696520 [compost metagenome]
MRIRFIEVQGSGVVNVFMGAIDAEDRLGHFVWAAAVGGVLQAVEFLQAQQVNDGSEFLSRQPWQRLVQQFIWQLRGCRVGILSWANNLCVDQLRIIA